MGGVGMITASLIVRNESANIVACLSSIRPHVDRIVVVDTGSEDDTPALCRDALGSGGTVETFTGCLDDEGRMMDFALARNYALSLVDPESWVFWIDGDDVVTGAEHLRSIADSDSDPVSMYLMPYEYSYDERGNVNVLHWRERLVRPAKAFKWHGPVHEVLMPREGRQVIAKQTDLVVVKHRRSGKAYDPTRNLRILEPWCKGEGKGDLRGMFYLGMELRKAGRLEESRDMLTEYVAKTGWSDEKCIAQLELASLELQCQNFEQAAHWGLQAQFTKSWPDPYYIIGYAAHEMALRAKDREQKLYNYRRAAHYLRRGSELGLNGGAETVLFSNPSELFEAQNVLCACLATLEDWQGAVESCRLGLRGNPNNQGLKDYLREFEDRRDIRQLRATMGELVRRGGLTREQAMVIEKTLNGEFQVKMKRSQLKEPKPGQVFGDGKGMGGGLGRDGLRVVFFTGPAYEDWDPKKVETEGMGGSETMCVELAKRLSKMGHAVRVYGQPAQEGEFDGVLYLHHDRWGHEDVAADVLVASRIPEAVDSGTFGLRLLWVHDVHCGDGLTRHRMLRFDYVLALSEWHKSFLLGTYPMLDESQVVVTRNGIDLSRFSGTGIDGGQPDAGSSTSPGPRQPSRAIYSSSPDRGLRLALKLWPRIREQVPDAELHVYYGFDNWEKSADRWPDHPELCRAALEEVKAGLNQPGVFYHGRVGPAELARAFLESGVWFYPTWFSETSCITAMEAQAAGCHVVTTELAALTETVRTGSKYFMSGEYGYGCEDHAHFLIENVVADMTIPKNEERRQYTETFARAAFSLDTLAKDWSEMMFQWLDELSEQPVHPYKPWRAA